MGAPPTLAAALPIRGAGEKAGAACTSLHETCLENHRKSATGTAHAAAGGGAAAAGRSPVKGCSTGALCSPPRLAALGSALGGARSITDIPSALSLADSASRAAACSFLEASPAAAPPAPPPPSCSGGGGSGSCSVVSG